MSKQRKRYSKEEKLEIVKLSINDQETICSLSNRFGISEASIYRWRKMYLEDNENDSPKEKIKPISTSDRRLLELEKENRELKLERDILKKAVGIFSKSDKKFSNL